MAKGKKGKGTRDSTAIASSQLRSRPKMVSPLTLIEDRRSYDFEPATRPARLFSGSVASMVATPKIIKGKIRNPASVPYQIAFAAPRETLICVRRKMRREVLHALRRKGKGGRGRRGKWSNVKC